MTVTFDKHSSRKIFVAIGVCLIALAGLGFGNGALSLWVVPICEELGIARSVYTLYATISKIIGAVVAMLFAVIYRKIGAKGLCFLAVVGYIAHYLCMAFATNVGLIYVGGVFNGIGYTFSGALTYFAILPPWYEKAVGTVTGIAASMSGIAASTVTMVGTALLGQYGYRNAILMVAAIIAVLGVIAFFLVKTAPNDPAYGKNAVIEDKKKKDPSQPTGLALYKMMFKEPATLMCMAFFFVIGFVGYAISSIFIPIGNARGFDATYVAAAYAAHYVVLIFGKIICGMIKDKWGVKVVTPILFVLCITTTAIIAYAPESWFMAAGFIWGAGTVINQIYPPYLMIDSFGKYYNAAFVGAGLSVYQLGRALGEPAVHLSYDLTGSYDIGMAVWLVLWVALWVMSGIMMKLGKKYQQKMEAQGISAGVKDQLKEAEG